LIDRVCDYCHRQFWPSHPTQRWCNATCRELYRNAELRAARKLWAKAGKPKPMLDECRDEQQRLRGDDQQ
jgi:hypothetical protein